MSVMERMKKYNKQEIFKDNVSTLRGDGEWNLRRGNYKQALSSFNSVLALTPQDKKCLVTRSKCYQQMGQLKNALIDAEASLKEDALLPEGLYQKADVLYHMGEFEFALVFYHRGQKVRPQMDEFRLGIQRAEDAITIAVGNPSAVKLQVEGNLSYLKDEEKRVHPIAVVQNLTENKEKQTSETLKNKRTTKQQLGEFYQHKKFLEKLLKDKGLVKDVTKRQERVEDIIQNGITSFNSRVEFLTQETLITLKEKKDPPKQQKFSSASDKVQFLLRSLEEIDGELTSGNAKCSLKKAEDLMRTVEGWSKKVCPIKEEIICFLHSCIGNASFDLGDVHKALKHHHKDLAIAEQCKFLEATSRALGNIGRTYAENGQFAKAIEFLEKKIPFIHGDVENTWLLHDIGCCYLELSHPDKARDYGLRSVAAAEDLSDYKWQLRASVLLGQSEFYLGNIESSVSNFKKALSLAKCHNDSTAHIAILMALVVIRKATTSLGMSAAESNLRTSIYEDLVK